jgi:hypothetical protein
MGIECELTAKMFSAPTRVVQMATLEVKRTDPQVVLDTLSGLAAGYEGTWIKIGKTDAEGRTPITIAATEEAAGHLRSFVPHLEELYRDQGVDLKYKPTEYAGEHEDTCVAGSLTGAMVTQPGVTLLAQEKIAELAARAGVRSLQWTTPEGVGYQVQGARAAALAFIGDLMKLPNEL